jgi:hypothetical protein
MIDIDATPLPGDIASRVDDVFTAAQGKIMALAKRWKPEAGAPVFTVRGKYSAKGWTEWTQGFQFGGALLVYEATGEPWFLEYGRSKTQESMAPHLTHMGVHDHGFNNISTYGNLLRFQREGLVKDNLFEKKYYELALKVSGAVQAARWTDLPGDLGYVYSFNGAHSLFADTIRSLRSLAISHGLGHALMGEGDTKINLLRRLLQHAETTSRYIVFFGNGRDHWDVRGRVAHEAIFNLDGGAYRCPSSQQGYSPFSTWTRGLAWIILGYTEQLEYLSALPAKAFSGLALSYYPDKKAVLTRFLDTATAVSDFYIANTPTDGIPYWDTGAPGLAGMGDYLDRQADPYNDIEPVDASAAAIAAQGLLRLGTYLKGADGERYLKAGMKTAETLMAAPYLSTATGHEGLLLHAVYHQPNAWDYVPRGKHVPSGESCQWGDYHLLELALWLKRHLAGKPELKFYSPV